MHIGDYNLTIATEIVFEFPHFLAFHFKILHIDLPTNNMVGFYLSNGRNKSC